MNERAESTGPVREQILQAALSLFAELSYNRTTTSALARRAGIAEGTLFRHFKSKEEVLLALLTRVRDRLMQGLERYLAPHSREPGYIRVISTIQGYYTFATQNREEFNVIFREGTAQFGGGDAEAMHVLGSTYTFLTAYLQKAIEDGKADGTISASVNSADTASIILALIVGLARGVHFTFIRNTGTLPASLLEFCARALKA